MNKKILAIFTAQIVIISAIFGFSRLASAEDGILGSTKGFFENLYENIIKPFIPAPKSSAENPKEENKDQTLVPISGKEEPKEAYAPTIDYEEAVISAVDKSSPAVVSIIISKDMPIIESCLMDPSSGLPSELQGFFGGKIYVPCEKGTQKQEIGGGSGFIISGDGLIVTNRHVVEDISAEYTVLTKNGNKYPATVVSRDTTRDFAVMKISASGLPILRLGDSDTIKLGQTAIAIGNALGEFRNTVSVGVVSGLSRDIVASDGNKNERIEDVIQTDAAINSGNSGGPLLNLKGEVIGINVATVQGAQNIGFAIPINQVKNAIQSVKNYGRIISPYLGVRYVLIDEALAKKENLLVKEGALISGSDKSSAIYAGSPAEKAGLKSGDIILTFNGEKITQNNSLSLLIAKRKVGDRVSLKIIRGGKEEILTAVLEERPAE